MGATTVDVSRVTSEGKLTWFHFRLLALVSLLTLFDGYDITAVSFAAPELAKAWSITDKSAFAPVFSASLVGMLLGAPLIGWAGDRYGRRPAVIASCLLFGISTLAMMHASSLSELIIYRFIAGIGMGGLLPNASALNVEYSPVRHRATMIIVMYVGTALGGALPGPIAAILVPLFGWQVLFLIGGALPILGAIAAWLWLPESVRYLVANKRNNNEVVRLLKSLGSPREVYAASTFHIGEATKPQGASVKMLFSGGLKVATPLVWLLFILNLMGYFFLLSWTPLLLVGANVSLEKAAIAFSIFQLGGIVGGLCIARPMDRWGLKSIIAYFIAGAPIIGCIGFVAKMESEIPLMLIIFFGGFFTLGIQLGINAICAMIYPTAIRSSGAGWAIGMGRLGSIVGPIFGGMLIAANLPVEKLYLIGAIPFAVGAVAALALEFVSRTHFAGKLLDDNEAISGGRA